MTHDDDLSEKYGPYSLSEVAREFNVSRDTAKTKLLRSGAQPTRDNLWRLRDVLLAFAKPGCFSSVARLEIERKRVVEALSPQL